jgi:hypothetical protein
MQGPLTFIDMLKLMSGVVSFFCALNFFWMRYLKNEMRADRKAAKEEMRTDRNAAKEDMRTMFRGMHKGFEEKYLLKLSNLCTRVDKLEDWYLAHYKSYHSKSGGK